MTGLSRLTGRVLNALLSLLPDRTKRMMFVASVAGAAQEKDDLGDEVLSRLNGLMKLCSSDRAMELPVKLNKVIWNGEVVHDVNRVAQENGKASPEAMAEALAKLKDSMPAWMRYDGDMVDADLKTLVDHKFGTK